MTVDASRPERLRRGRARRGLRRRRGRPPLRRAAAPALAVDHRAGTRAAGGAARRARRGHLAPGRVLLRLAGPGRPRQGAGQPGRAGPGAAAGAGRAAPPAGHRHAVVARGAARRLGPRRGDGGQRRGRRGGGRPGRRARGHRLPAPAGRAGDAGADRHRLGVRGDLGGRGGHRCGQLRLRGPARGRHPGDRPQRPRPAGRYRRRRPGLAARDGRAEPAGAARRACSSSASSTRPVPAPACWCCSPPWRSSSPASAARGSSWWWRRWSSPRPRSSRSWPPARSRASRRAVATGRARWTPATSPGGPRSRGPTPTGSSSSAAASRSRSSGSRASSGTRSRWTAAGCRSWCRRASSVWSSPACGCCGWCAACAGPPAQHRILFQGLLVFVVGRSVLESGLFDATPALLVLVAVSLLAEGGSRSRLRDEERGAQRALPA